MNTASITADQRAKLAADNLRFSREGLVLAPASVHPDLQGEDIRHAMKVSDLDHRATLDEEVLQAYATCDRAYGQTLVPGRGTWASWLDLIGQAAVTNEQAEANRAQGKGIKRPREALIGKLPFSSPTLGRRIKSGDFPAPVKLSKRITVWRVEDVRAGRLARGGQYE